MASAPREQWSSRTGFVLAAIGSAVGLGNMWRFSYLTAENGGAAFVLLYVGVTLLIGLPVLLAELVLGRGAQRSPIRALVAFGGSGWAPLGALFVITGTLIASYYGVIAGWTLRYSLIAISEGFGPGIQGRFGEVAAGPQAFAYHAVFMGACLFVISSGVRTGIERMAMLLMPVLFVIVIGLALYASTFEGAGAGYTYYLEADFSKLMSMGVLRAAAGQAFFSLSIGMGAMLTFASYVGRDQHLPNESTVIAAADVGVAFVAGLVVFPMIFALGLNDEVSGSTVGALFITLPHAFAEMGAVGRVVGPLFFVALLVGAITSAVSILEVVTATGMDELGWSRAKATWVLGGVVTLLGVPAAFDTDFLSVADEVANNILLLGGGIALAVFVGYVMPDPVREAQQGAEGVRWFFLWRFLLRFAVPIFLGFVFVTGLPDTWAAITGLFAGGS